MYEDVSVLPNTSNVANVLQFCDKTGYMQTSIEPSLFGLKYDFGRLAAGAYYIYAAIRYCNGLTEG